ncbi:Hypothetical predicted protein [Xyrichtys novacula]|uniref:Uncharacterized protein n=1 Tax=Xyrichtys novacula TaxID=13765 RepID=A0AAV1H846_XYRNO|nr:Hypothetical predicted protein [Xyrichtys novacula]
MADPSQGAPRGRPADTQERSSGPYPSQSTKYHLPQPLRRTANNLWLMARAIKGSKSSERSTGTR